MTIKFTHNQLINNTQAYGPIIFTHPYVLGSVIGSISLVTSTKKTYSVGHSSRYKKYNFISFNGGYRNTDSHNLRGISPSERLRVDSHNLVLSKCYFLIADKYILENLGRKPTLVDLEGNKVETRLYNGIIEIVGTPYSLYVSKGSDLVMIAHRANKSNDDIVKVFLKWR